MNKRGVISKWRLCLLAALSSSLLAGCKLLPKEEEVDIPALIQPSDVQLVTHTITVGPIDEELRGIARVGSGREQDLYFPLAGRVREIYVKYGDEVAKGQLLAELETGDLDFSLKQAQINQEQEKLRFDLQYGNDADRERAVRLAELEVERAEIDLSRAESRLRAESLVASAQRQQELESDVRKAELTLEKAEIELANALAGRSKYAAEKSIAALNLQRAQVEYDRLAELKERSVLRAPFAGKITSLSLVRGQSVEPFAPVATVSDMKGLELISTVSPVDALKLRLGLRVKIHMNEGRTEMGRVFLIEHKTKTGREEWLVHIRMDDPRFPLVYDDMYTVAYVLRSAAKALLVPNDAVREDASGLKYLRVIEGEKRRDVYIKVGIVGATHTQILEGARAGQVVMGK
ncbi:MAG: biotin/lipoyl-binding protein [Firmicutes bacterium]|nr:biotin/lipoyl-binding protein [Bacillota bacterium]